MTASEPTELRRALVTGATGFIGGHLVRYLASHGWDVHALARQELSDPETKECCTWHRYDGSYESVAEAISSSGVNSVFHLASLFLSAHTPTDISRLVDANLRFGMQLLEAMQQYQVNRLVNTGTTWQHFNDADYDPVNLYAATKQAFEAIIDYYCNAHRLSAISLKLGDTYAKNDIRRKLIPLLREAIDHQQVMDLTEGDQRLSILSVFDVCEGFLTASNLLAGPNQGHRRFSLMNPNTYSIKEIAEQMEQFLGRRGQLHWGKRAQGTRQPTPPTKLEALPNWRPRFVTLPDILKT